MSFLDLFSSNKSSTPLNLELPDMDFSVSGLSNAGATNPLSESGTSIAPSFNDSSIFSNGSMPTLNMPQGTTPTFMQKAMGYTDPTTGQKFGGFAAPVIGALQSGLSFWQGKQQLDLAKDQLSTQKSQFADQFNVQKQLTNMSIQDQGDRRYSRNSTLNESGEDYYNKNKIA